MAASNSIDDKKQILQDCFFFYPKSRYGKAEEACPRMRDRQFISSDCERSGSFDESLSLTLGDLIFCPVHPAWPGSILVEGNSGSSLAVKLFLFLHAVNTSTCWLA